MTEALRAVMMFGEGLGGVLKELAVLIGVGAALFAVASWRMRRQFVAR